MALDTGREPNASTTKVALYARVSTDKQRDEATIESQVCELKRQITAAGHVLAKEFIDDGYSGAYLDRPALDELRAAIKTDAFDAVYFLCPDRIARDTILQNIIIGELLQHKKRIVLNGKDYEENPENRFALTVLGAVAEFERAKITERMMRGKIHRLRSGVLVAGGTIYGYTYQRRTPTSAPALVINEEQAAIVRFMFETYATTAISTAGIARILEERGVKTYRGLSLWERGRIVKILQNPTYTGVRYLNQLAVVHEAPGSVRTTKRRRFVQRNRDEWIGIKVPAIVSQELFDKVQERLRVVQNRYCKLSQTALLTGYVRCADCGRNLGHGYMQSRYRLRSGEIATHERGQYRCSKRQNDSFHHVSNRGRCRNTSIATTLLDHTVVDLIRDYMLDPDKLATCIDASSGNATPPPDLRRIASEIDALNEKRRRIYDAYAKEQTTAEAYIETSRAIDEGIVALRGQRDALLIAWRQASSAETLAASLRQFCATARARFEACDDLDAKRAFFSDYVESVTFDHGKVTILGSLPHEGAAHGKASFSIAGRITKGSKRRWPQDERLGSWVPINA